jgi:hypothetical protein
LLRVSGACVHNKTYNTFQQSSQAASFQILQSSQEELEYRQVRKKKGIECSTMTEE